MKGEKRHPEETEPVKYEEKKWQLMYLEMRKDITTKKVQDVMKKGINRKNKECLGFKIR